MATMYGEVGGCFTALRIVTLIFALIHTVINKFVVCNDFPT